MAGRSPELDGSGCRGRSGGRNGQDLGRPGPRARNAILHATCLLDDDAASNVVLMTATPHASDRPALEERAEVAVIGGGVVGVCAALALAERGRRVILLEKGRVAGEQSSRNWGWIRAQGRALEELPLMLEAAGLWRRFAAEAGEIGYRAEGSTYLAQTEAELSARADWLEAARAFQLDTRLLSRAEVGGLLGRADGRFAGALHTPSDAHAEPALAVPALAALARSKGARIEEGCAVRALLREGGRVRGVVTERGVVRADAVILAGGIWSRPLMENEGSGLAQLAIRSSVLRTGPAPRVPGVFGAPAASIRPRADGGYTVARSGAAGFEIVPAAFGHFRAFWPILRDRWRILRLSAGRSFFGPLGRRCWAADEASPFEAVRVMDPAPDERLLARVMEDVRGLYPALAEARPVASWAGMIDVTPDELPVIGEAPGLPGLVLATGLSGHGFGIGPGAGLLAAQIATGDRPVVDPAPFAPARLMGRAAA